MNKESNNQPAYHSLQDIRMRKEELLDGIRKDRKAMGKLVGNMFEPERRARQKGITLSGLLNTGVGLLDGALFAWKLYRKFRR